MVLEIIHRQLQDHLELLQLELAAFQFRSKEGRLVVIAQQMLIVGCTAGGGGGQQMLRQNHTCAQPRTVRSMTALADSIETVAGSDDPRIRGRPLQIFAKIFKNGWGLRRERSKVIDRLIHARRKACRRNVVAQNSAVHHLRKETCLGYQFAHQVQNILLSLWRKRFLIPCTPAKRDNHDFALWWRSYGSGP